MSVEGLSQITLIVKDLARTSDLLVNVLGAQEVYGTLERKLEAYTG